MSTSFQKLNTWTKSVINIQGKVFDCLRLYQVSISDGINCGYKAGLYCMKATFLEVFFSKLMRAQWAREGIPEHVPQHPAPWMHTAGRTYWQLLTGLPLLYDGTFSCNNLLSCTVFKCKNLSCSRIGLPSTTGNIRLPVLLFGIGRPRPIESVAAKSVCWTRVGCLTSPRKKKTV